MAVNDSNNTTTPYSFTKKVWITAGIFSLFVIVMLLFKALFSLVLLILAGILIAVFFYGFAGLIQQYLHLSPKLSIILSVVFNLLLLVAFFWFVGTRLSDQISSLSETLPKTVEQAKSHLNNSALGSKMLDYLQSSGNTQKTVSAARRFFSSSFGIVSDLYIVILLGLFFTASPSVYKKGIIHLLPSAAKDKGDALINDIGDVLKKWLKGQIFGFFFITVLSGIGLWIIGMPLILTLALIAGLMNFIPNFGPIIALIPAVLLALTQGPTTAIIIACMYTGIQVIQSAVTQPLIQKKMISIPPALTIIGQVAMGALGGFWGVLLATPIVAILIKIITELYIEPQPYHKYKVESTN